MNNRIKKLWICSWLFLFTSTLLAQKKVEVDKDQNPRLSQTIVFPESSNAWLFDRYPDLEYIDASYLDGQHYSTFFNYYPGGNRDTLIREFYDQDFAGDRHLMRMKYGDSVRFIVPKIDVGLIYAQRDTAAILNDIWAQIYRDSVVYHCRQERVPERYYKDTGVGIPARYRGDLNVLADTLSARFARSGTTDVNDSVLVFQCIAEDSGKASDGWLRDFQLLAGQPSDFSRFIQQELEATGSKWKPAALFAGKRKTTIFRIYAKLAADGSITLQTPRMLGRVTGY